jgi:hypothetical protein
MPATVCLVPVIWARGYSDGENILRISNSLLVDALFQVAIQAQEMLMLIPWVVLWARVGI